MKNNLLKIGALVLAIALIIGVGIFANSLVGNPLSKALAKNTAEKYIEENYADKNCELEDIEYSFKDGYYHASVSTPGSIDGSFTLMINGFGKLKYDNYDYNVTNGWNTANRLDADYRKTVETIFNSDIFPYNAHIGYGELMFLPLEGKEDPGACDYAFITDDLTPDAYYNVNEFGTSSGKLTVYVEDSTVSYERMAEILLGIRECFDASGVGFYAIDCVLEYPLGEDGRYEYGQIEVIEFLYEDIYDDGLVDRVKAADEAARAYYSAQDI